MLLRSHNFEWDVVKMKNEWIFVYEKVVTLKTEASRSFETLVSYHKTTRRYKSEDLRSRNKRSVPALSWRVENKHKNLSQNCRIWTGYRWNRGQTCYRRFYFRERVTLHDHCTNSTEQSPSCEANSHAAGKEISASYRNRRFVIVFTKVHLWSLSSARLIDSTTLHLICLRSILILPSNLCLGLPSGLSSSDFLTKILYAFFFPHACYMPHSSHPSWFGNPNNTTYLVWSTNYETPHYAVISNVLLLILQTPVNSTVISSEMFTKHRSIC
jgi:hypothetical protein